MFVPLVSSNEGVSIISVELGNSLWKSAVANREGYPAMARVCWWSRIDQGFHVFATCRTGLGLKRVGIYYHGDDAQYTIPQIIVGKAAPSNITRNVAPCKDFRLGFYLEI